MPLLVLRVLALACVACALLAPAAAAKPAEPPRPAAAAWILVDARDGKRLAAENATKRRSIASATKLMTAYLALREENLQERVPAPAYRPVAAESLLGLEPGERISYRELIYALILASANDGAVAVAEGVAGSVDRFVAKMNAAARRLDLRDTSYANPIGLDAPGNYSTAADLARLATVLLEDDFFRRVADTETRTVETDRASRRIVTRDDLLTRVPWVTGIKTGFTGEAGNVLVGSGEREGVRLIAVVLGAPSEAARDDGVLSLLEYGFSLYDRKMAVRGREALAEPPVDSGGVVKLVARRPVAVSVRRDQEIETAVDAPAELAGPIHRGERLGSVEVTVDGRPAGSSALIAARGAPAPSLGDGVRNNFPTLAAVGGALVVIVVGTVIVRRARRADGRGAVR